MVYQVYILQVGGNRLGQLKKSHKEATKSALSLSIAKLALLILRTLLVALETLIRCLVATLARFRYPSYSGRLAWVAKSATRFLLKRQINLPFARFARYSGFESPHGGRFRSLSV